MSAPKIVLLARSDLQNNLEAVQAFFNVCPLEMAIAPTPEDAEQAQKVTPAVGFFHKLTAIVADYPASMVIDENGQISPLVLSDPSADAESPLIQLAG